MNGLNLFDLDLALARVGEESQGNMQAALTRLIGVTFLAQMSFEPGERFRQ
ncbi:hypothetical protein D9M72_616740 [compost metagenome]